MSLIALLAKGGLQDLATATVATMATDRARALGSVAIVATVAVADSHNSLTSGAIQTSAAKSQPLPLDAETIRQSDGSLLKLLTASPAQGKPISISGRSPGDDSDRWCYPNSSAMNGSEIDIFTARLSMFSSRGLTLDEAEKLADSLVLRDRQKNHSQHCLECRHLIGQASSTWRCGNSQFSEDCNCTRANLLLSGLTNSLQDCAGFTSSILSTTNISTRDWKRQFTCVTKSEQSVNSQAAQR